MHDADGHSITGFLVLLIAVLSASGSAWLWIFHRWPPGRPLLKLEPRRPVPWGISDAVMILVGWVMLQALLPALLRPLLGMEPLDPDVPKTPEDFRVMMLGVLVANVIAGVCTPLWLWFGRGARAADLGFSTRCLPADLWRGAVAFAAVSVPVYALQMLLVKFFPSHHPLVQLLQESRDAATIVISVLMASIAAPIVEEMLFRLVLQGALETVESRALTSADPLETIAAPATEEEYSPSEIMPSSGQSNSAEDNAYAAPRLLDHPANAPDGPSNLPPESAAADASDIVGGQKGPSRFWGLRPGIWPIAISSSVFALAHWQHGPDPIPLFVLAVVLGYLYRQTHRIVPSIVVHVLLNSCSLATLWLQPPGK